MTTTDYTSEYPLLHFPLLAGLSPRHQALIVGAAEEVSYLKGQRLFSKDGPARGCWLVRRGQIALDTTTAGNPAPSVVHVLGAGQVVGWSWLVPPYRWRFGATARTPVRAVRLDTDRLRALADADPGFGRALALAMLRLVADRLSDTRISLADGYRTAGTVP